MTTPAIPNLPVPPPMPKKQPLQVRRDAVELAPGKPCPNCKKEIPTDSSMCIFCGYDMETKKVRKPLKRKKRSAKSLFVLGTLLSAGLLTVAVLMMMKDEGHLDKVAEAAPVKAAVEKVQQVLPVAERVVSVKKETPLPPRELIAGKTPPDAPPARPGDSLVLFRKNGQIERGVFQGLESGKNGETLVALKTDIGRITIPVFRLDTKSQKLVEP